MSALRSFLGRHRALGTVIAASALLAGYATAPASAAVNTYLIGNTNSGQCLEIGGWSQSWGAGADQWKCLDDSTGWLDKNQQWELAFNNRDGLYQIINVNSGQCLEIGGWATGNGAKADQWKCLYDGSGLPDRNQEWNINSFGQIINVNSGKCLEIGGWSQSWGAAADQWDCLYNGSGADANQVWMVEPVVTTA